MGQEVCIFIETLYVVSLICFPQGKGFTSLEVTQIDV